MTASHEKQNRTARHHSHSHQSKKKTNDHTKENASSAHLMSSKKTKIERHARKKAKQAHMRRTLRKLKEDDDLFLDQCIETVEDEKTANAKRNNNKNENWKLVVRGYNNKKPKPWQTVRNTAYNFGTSVKRALSSSNKVRFASKIATICTYNKVNKPSRLWVTFDSGADAHYIKEKDRRAASLPILRNSSKRVGVANGEVSQGIHETRLPIPQLPKKATKADTFNKWSSNLMSVGRVCDANTLSIFSKDGVKVYKEDDVLVTCKGKPILIGIRDDNGRYRIPLEQRKGQWRPRHPSKKAKKILRQANSVYDLPSTEEAIKWMHAVCGYPVKSTWIKAIKAGNYVGWPMLTERNVKKYYPETNETPKGHMAQTRKNVRSTKPNPIKEYKNKDQLVGKKKQDIFTKVYDIRDTIFSDQTGQFPTRSRRGNKYIMVMVEIDSNAILVEPMKSRKDAEMIRAYNSLMLRIKRAGITVKKHVLDNEVSENMKNHIRDEYKLQMELVPPGCHRRNAAEVAIRNFKAHFLSILAGTAEDFPISLWDRLLPQAEITVNLIRQSNATPTVSAYAHLSGPFDYNKMPLAPMGCDAQIHEKKDKRGTWSYHSVDGWYLNTSPEHYRTHNCAIKSTKSERLTDTIQVNHKRITNPTLTHADKVMKALADSIKNIRRCGGDASQQTRDLITLIKGTRQVVENNPHLMEQDAQSNKTATVPRVRTPITNAVKAVVDEGRRITRSMSTNINEIMTGISSNINQQTSAKVKNNSSNISRQVPRVGNSNRTPSSKRLRKLRKRSKQSPIPSGPATRTRSKTAPVAANTRTANKRVSGIPKPTPSYLRGTKSSTSRNKKGTANAAVNMQRRRRKHRKLNRRMTRLENEVHEALAVMDKETGKMLNYRQLIRHAKYKEVWSKSSANEFGRLANGVGGRIKGTNTIKFIHEREVPTNRKKDVTYGQFVCTIRPEKAEQERTRFTVGGDRINYPGDVATPTAEMLVAKMLFNSVVSTPGARCMCMDISNFYLMTPLKRPEYIKIKLSDIPDEIINEYKLEKKVTKNGCIYIVANRGMYGLPQSGLLANQLLQKRLNKHGYFQSKLVPGLWSHKTRPIQFTLVVDDFCVKYVGEEHARHLQAVLKKDYKVTTDWAASRYIGITLDWDYNKKQVHLSMPGYVKKALKQFQHIWTGKSQHSPFQSAPIKYGAKKQYAKADSNAPKLNKKGKKFVQQVCGKFLFLGRAVDSTLLCPISAIASQAAEPTEDTLRETTQLLDYLATQEEAVLTYNASDMILAVHSDASYLSEPKARSRAGGHFFLSSDSDIPNNNGAILNIAHIIKNVMSSATEAELAALYIMAREAVYIRIILEEMGHKQPKTPIQTDNAMANAVVNGIVQPKRTKAMDMRFHWLRDREAQEQFRIHWRPGKSNYADYWTKHHPAKHHTTIRREFLTPLTVVEMLRIEQAMNKKVK